MQRLRILLLPVFLLILLSSRAQDNPGAQPQQWIRGLLRANWLEAPISAQMPGDTLRHGVDSARRIAILGSVLYVSVKDTATGGIHWVPISGSGSGGGKDTIIFQGGDTTVQNIINQYFGDTIINYLYTTYLDSVVNYLITNQYFQDTVVQQVFNNTYFQDTVVQSIFNNTYFQDTVIQSIFNNSYFQDTVVQSIFNNTYFFDTTVNNSLFNTYLTTVVNNIVDSSISVLNPLQTHQQTLITGSRMTQDNAIILDNTRYAWTYRDSTVTSDTSGSSAIVLRNADVGVLIAPKSSWVSVAPLLKVRTLRDGVSFNGTVGGTGVYKTMSNAGYRIALTVNAYPADSTHGFPSTTDEVDTWSCNIDSLMVEIDSSGANVPWIHIENEPTTLHYRIDPLHHLADYIRELSIAIPIVHAHGHKISDGGPASVNLKWVIWDWLRTQSGRSADAEEFKQFEFTSSQQATMDGWASDPAHADAIAFIKGLYAAEDTMAIDAANFHWYIQDWQSSVHANSLIWAVEAIHALSGHRVVTNELGQQNELSNIPPEALSALDSRVDQIIWFDGDGTAARALHNPDNTLRTNGIAFVNYEQGLINTPVVDTTSGTAAVVSYQEKQFFSLENGNLYQRNKKKSYVQLALLDTSGRVNWIDTVGLFHAGTGGTAGVTSFNTRTGAVTLTSSDVLTALGYTPYNVTNPAGYISGNQSITWTGSGDVSGSASGATSIAPTLTVNGLKSKALPTLATGNLRYNGTSWVFDNTTYLSSNQPITVTATGDATGTSTSSATAPSLPLTLATVNPNVGTFGSSSLIPVITTDGKGRITGVTTVSVAGAAGGTVISVGLSSSTLNLSGTNPVTGSGTINAEIPSNYVTTTGVQTLSNKTFIASTTADPSFVLPLGNAPAVPSPGQYYATSIDNHLWWVDGTSTPQRLDNQVQLAGILNQTTLQNSANYHIDGTGWNGKLVVATATTAYPIATSNYFDSAQSKNGLYFRGDNGTRATLNSFAQRFLKMSWTDSSNFYISNYDIALPSTSQIAKTLNVYSNGALNLSGAGQINLKTNTNVVNGVSLNMAAGSFFYSNVDLYFATTGTTRAITYNARATGNTLGGSITITPQGATPAAVVNNLAGGYLELHGGVAEGTGISGVNQYGYVAGTSGNSDNSEVLVSQTAGGYFTFKYATMTADPTTTDIAAGMCRIVYNSTSTTLKMWCNVGGVLHSVAIP